MRLDKVNLNLFAFYFHSKIFHLNDLVKKLNKLYNFTDFQCDIAQYVLFTSSMCVLSETTF